MMRTTPPAMRRRGFPCPGTMPYAARKPCKQAGCGALVDAGYCAAHADRAYARRPSAAARGYGRRWRRLRRYKLGIDPVCQHEGCNRGATEVDHIKPLTQGGGHDLSNLQSLCRSHHSEKTAREDGGFGR